MVRVFASVNLPLHHKVQKFSSGTGLPGWSQKKGRKTVVVWYIQVTGDGCSRWSRYLSDNYTDVADAECDDDDYLPRGVCDADLTASIAGRFPVQHAASKFMRLALLSSHRLLLSVFVQRA